MRKKPFCRNFAYYFAKFFKLDIKADFWAQTEHTGSEYSLPDALETFRTAGGGYRASPYQNFALRLQTGFCRVYRSTTRFKVSNKHANTVAVKV